MTKPLTDPILEAAAQIVWVFVNSHAKWNLDDCRVWATRCNSCGVDIVKEAARQIDALRAAGVIPKEVENE